MEAQEKENPSHTNSKINLTINSKASISGMNILSIIFRWSFIKAQLSIRVQTSEVKMVSISPGIYPMTNISKKSSSGQEKESTLSPSKLIKELDPQDSVKMEEISMSNSSQKVIR